MIFMDELTAKLLFDFFLSYSHQLNCRYQKDKMIPVSNETSQYISVLS